MIPQPPGPTTTSSMPVLLIGAAVVASGLVLSYLVWRSRSKH